MPRSLSPLSVPPRSLPRLPLIPDSRPRILEHLLRDGVMYALDDLINNSDVVGMVLVVPEPVHAPPAPLVDITLYDAAHKRVAQPLQGVPLVFCHEQLPVLDVRVRPALDLPLREDEQLRGGDALVVDVGLCDALGAVLLVGLYQGEIQLQLEVDRVLVRGLPLEDVLVRAALVRRLAARKNQPVVAVRQVRQHLAEHLDHAVRELHLLHDQLERLEPRLLGVLLEHLAVRGVDLLVEVGEALVEGPLEERHAVQGEAVKHQELGLLDAARPRLPAHDQLAVDDGLVVLPALVLGRREVQVAVLHEPEVVLAVDQVGDLLAVLVRRQVEEVAYAVCLFADKVTVVAGDNTSANLLQKNALVPFQRRVFGRANLLLGHELLQVPPREAHGLCAGEADLRPPEQAGDLLAQLLEELALGSDAGLVDASDGLCARVHGVCDKPFGDNRVLRRRLAPGSVWVWWDYFRHKSSKWGLEPIRNNISWV